MTSSTTNESSCLYMKDMPMASISDLSVPVEEDSAKSKLMESISDLTAAFEESSKSNLTSSTSDISAVFEDGLNSKLMASLSDLSAAFVDGTSSKNQSISHLMSSVRSIVDGDGSFDDLLDSWQDSFISDAGEDQDFNRSMKNLLTAVNDLLHSRVTFTLNEEISLDTELTRLKEMRAQKSKQFELKQSNDDSFILAIPASSSGPVQEHKVRLADTLRAALEVKEDAINTPSTPRQLNPGRFEANGCDPAPMIPILRHQSPLLSDWGRVVCRASLDDHASLSPLKRRASASPLAKIDGTTHMERGAHRNPLFSSPVSIVRTLSMRLTWTFGRSLFQTQYRLLLPRHR